MLGCLVIGMSVVGLTVFWARAVTGGGLDIGAHYLITNWIMEHWNLPSTDPALQGFSDYPAGSHFLAAVIGKVVGSPILGLQLAAFGAITTVWLATASILAMYPRTKRYLALGFLALLILLNSPVGPFSAQGYGFEAVYPEQLSFREQVETFASAEMVMGPSGAAYANMLFCQKKTRWLTWLLPQYAGFCAYSNLANVVGMDLRYLFVTPHTPIKSSFNAYSAAYTLESDRFSEALRQMNLG